MISLEQAFSDTERAAESALRAARGLTTQARALERAAKTGNIAAIEREQKRLAEALSVLQQEVQNAASSWPFSDEEVERYLEERYTDELRGAGWATPVSRCTNVMGTCSPILRYCGVLPREKAVRVDRKKNSAIRPTHLAEMLLKNQDKEQRLFVRSVP